MALVAEITVVLASGVTTTDYYYQQPTDRPTDRPTTANTHPTEAKLDTAVFQHILRHLRLELISASQLKSSQLAGSREHHLVTV